MAVGHEYFNDQLPYGRLLRLYCSSLDLVNDMGPKLQAMFAQMLDGDGSQDAHFPYMQSKFGFTDNATARAFWNEFQSLHAKLQTTGGAGVTTFNVLDAIKQFLAKTR